MNREGRPLTIIVPTGRTEGLLLGSRNPEEDPHLTTQLHTGQTIFSIRNSNGESLCPLEMRIGNIFLVGGPQRIGQVHFVREITGVLHLDMSDPLHMTATIFPPKVPRNRGQDFPLVKQISLLVVLSLSDMGVLINRDLQLQMKDLRTPLKWEPSSRDQGVT